MYAAVFILLLCELAAVGLLIAPLSAATRRGLVRTVEQSGGLTSLRQPAFYFTIALASAWVYSLIQLVSAQGKLDAATSGTELRYESQLYFAQVRAACFSLSA